MLRSIARYTKPTATDRIIKAIDIAKNALIVNEKMEEKFMSKSVTITLCSLSFVGFCSFSIDTNI